jgi:hypothetical protein
VAQVVTTDLVVRSLPGVSDESEINDALLDEPTLLFVLQGPVAASGYEWYLVQPFTERICMDICPEPFPFGWVARTGKDGEQWIAPATLGCPEPTIEAIQWVTDPVRLACFGAETLRLTGKLGPCFAAETPIAQQQAGCLLYTTDHEPPEGFGPPGILVRFAEGVPLPANLEGEIVSVTGQFDHATATSCTWPEGSNDEFGYSDRETPSPQQVVLWCRTDFVVTALSPDA